MNFWTWAHKSNVGISTINFPAKPIQAIKSKECWMSTHCGFLYLTSKQAVGWIELRSFFSSFSSPSSLHNSSDTIRMRNFTSNLFSTKGVYALVFQIKYCQEWQWHKWKRKSSHWKRLHNWKLGNIKPQWSHMNPNAKSNEVRQSKKKLQPRSNREFLLSSDSNFAEASKYLPNQLLTSHLTGWHDFLCIRNTLCNANVQT